MIRAFILIISFGFQILEPNISAVYSRDGYLERYLADQDNILIPAVIIYEVYKILKREAGEEKALLAAGYMKN